MSTIPCRDCDNPVSESAEACPKCGCPDPSVSEADHAARQAGCLPPGCMLVLSLAFVLIGLVGFVGTLALWIDEGLTEALPSLVGSVAFFFTGVAAFLEPLARAEARKAAEPAPSHLETIPDAPAPGGDGTIRPDKWLRRRRK